MYYGSLIVISAISTTHFLTQRTKLCRIPNRWIVNSFTWMHYGSLIVVGAISSLLFWHKGQSYAISTTPSLAHKTKFYRIPDALTLLVLLILFCFWTLFFIVFLFFLTLFNFFLCFNFFLKKLFVFVDIYLFITKYNLCRIFYRKMHILKYSI